MDRLINIDNGGTLTDVVVWDAQGLAFTKTLTTPYDLSKCLFDGMSKVSKQLYDDADLEALLHSARHIRYSTTQGTNALVERKGPSIGLITDDLSVLSELIATPEQHALMDELVGNRVVVVDLAQDDEELGVELVKLVNRLTTDGAARIVVAVGDADRVGEHRLRRIMLRKFPRHLLGSVPVLYSWDLAADRNRARRLWSGLINTFLHPTMERFLYNAEDRLRSYRVRNPLLVYRNDGASSRVAKSVALKTYSSGPRGGLEGTRALAAAYGLRHVLMIDIGGTTTDLGSVRDSSIASVRHGSVEGVPISFPMSELLSYGIGGSSVIRARDGVIAVGPESVGAAPGPACFGFGGDRATITDVNLLLGVLDPSTYLDGDFSLNAPRAAAVVTASVAEPLGITLEQALLRMEEQYFVRLAEAITASVDTPSLEDSAGHDPAGITLAAFGGAGPMSACGAARIAGIRTILIPRLAAVFSAFGISFSDIGQSYTAALSDTTNDSLEAARAGLLDRAQRDMFQESYDLDSCQLDWRLLIEDAGGEFISETEYRTGEAVVTDSDGRPSLALTVTAALPHAELISDAGAAAHPAVPAGSRRIRSGVDQVDDVAVYRLDDQQPGAEAAGPAIVEGPFFTARVLAGWRLAVTSGGDLILTDTRS